MRWISRHSGDTNSRYIPVGAGRHTLTVAAYGANGKNLGTAADRPAQRDAS